MSVSSQKEAPPSFRVEGAIDGSSRRAALASGSWHVRALAHARRAYVLRQQLRTASKDLHWDLRAVDVLDHFGAQLFWEAWGRRLPSDVQLNPAQVEVFGRLERLSVQPAPLPKKSRFQLVESVGNGVLGVADHGRDLLALLGNLALDMMRFARHPKRGPWREISAHLYHAGTQALGITALVGFLIGVVLSYLSAQQLKLFGADIYIVNILAMSVVRELGPVLAAVLVAGRSGSAITAQLGVMRVTEELDAMRVMGIPPGLRLVLPRVIALGIAMPLLVVWTDAMALLGGTVAAQLELNLSYQYFLSRIPETVSIANLFIGIGKGAVFGMLIAMIGCHFGLRVEPNTESLGRGTTASVVVSITGVILADAVFAILFKDIGL